MNLLENPRLTETLVIPFVHNYCARKGIILQSIAQVPITGSKKGFFIMHYIAGGETKDMKSDPFVNESVRIFNLITKMNKTSHMYPFDVFDIEITRKK